MDDQIAAFLDAGREFFGNFQVETAWHDVLAKTPRYLDSTHNVAELLDAQRQTNRARNSLVAAGRELARTLEATGADSLPLLTFIRTVDGLGSGCGSGGPARAWPLWGPLAASLERLAIREGLPTGSTATPTGSTSTAARPPAATPGTDEGEVEGGIPSAKAPAPGEAKAPKATGDRPPTKRDRIREQRLAFCRPRRRKNPPETWDDICNAYRAKFPKDANAGPDTLRLTFERYEGKYSGE